MNLLRELSSEYIPDLGSETPI